MVLSYRYGEKTINDLVLLRQHHQLNLEPAFQRQSVWSLTDRRSFLQSILEGVPVPSIFLRGRTSAHGKLVYDVLDGILISLPTRTTGVGHWSAWISA